MEILTYDDLDTFGKDILLDQALAKSASVQAAGKNVFLSHSQKDNHRVGKVIRFLNRFKASVYVDSDDSALPETPSAETASILAENIQLIPRLVILVSPESYSSRWIPWELGLAHGIKGVAPVATLPIGPSAADEPWSRREYLGLYPRIVWTSAVGDPTERWRVVDPRDNAAWQLGDWLHRKSVE